MEFRHEFAYRLNSYEFFKFANCFIEYVQYSQEFNALLNQEYQELIKADIFFLFLNESNTDTKVTQRF